MIPIEWVQHPSYRIHLPIIGLASVQLEDDLALYLYYGVSQQVIDSLRNQSDEYDDDTIRRHFTQLLTIIFQGTLMEIFKQAISDTPEPVNNLPSVEDERTDEPMLVVLLVDCGMLICETDTVLELTCAVIPYTARKGKRNHLYFSFLLPEERDRFLKERNRFIKSEQ